jgi:glutathione S-transferase
MVSSSFDQGSRMNIKLYYAPGSCAFASLVALEEAGLHYAPIKVDFGANEQRSDAFLQVNPRGRVPTLLADGVTIPENIAVLTFIANAAPEAHLLPLRDPLRLAQAYEWMSWFASGIHVTIAQLWRSGRFTDEANGQRILQDAAPARLEAAFAEIEARLGSPWILGADYSVVDAYAAVFYRWASGRLAMDVGRYPRWRAHFERLNARPAVERAIAIEKGEPSKTV